MLGDRLAEARRRAGLSQVDLALALGDRYDQPMISHVEAGRKTLRFDGLANAAKALKVSSDYLLGLTDDPTPASDLSSQIGAFLDSTAQIKQPSDMGNVFPDPDDSYPPPADRVTFVENFPDGFASFDQVGPVVRLWSIRHPYPFDGHPHLRRRPTLIWETRPDATVTTTTGSVSVVRDGNFRTFEDLSQCLIVEVPGRSMEPTLPDGCIALVDKRHIRHRRRPGGIYLIDMGGPMVIRRAGLGPRGYWLLVCDNLECRSLVWPRGAKVIGEVRWVTGGEVRLRRTDVDR